MDEPGMGIMDMAIGEGGGIVSIDLRKSGKKNTINSIISCDNFFQYYTTQ